MTRYLLTHDGCACRDPVPGQVETPREVKLWLWGKHVSSHTVHDFECPYYFHVGDVRLVEIVLEDCPARVMRHVLPCRLWVGSTVLCLIGNASEGQPYQEISDMGWVTECYRSEFQRLWHRRSVPHA